MLQEGRGEAQVGQGVTICFICEDAIGYRLVFESVTDVAEETQCSDPS